MFHDDSDTPASSDANSEMDKNYIQEDYIIIRDGKKWSKFPHKSKVCTFKRNMLRQAPRLTRYSQELKSPLDAFQMLFSEKKKLILSTNVQKKRLHNLMILSGN